MQYNQSRTAVAMIVISRRRNRHMVAKRATQINEDEA
jgi:hypothetical protein